VNKLRANQPQGTQTYSDHEKAMKLLYALDRKVWEVKVQTIIESVSYETLTVDELFSKLKASEAEKLSRAKMEGNHADASASKSMALVGNSGANSNPSLMSVIDEQLEVLGNEELALIIHKFQRLQQHTSTSEDLLQLRQDRSLRHRVSQEEEFQG